MRWVLVLLQARLGRDGAGGKVSLGDIEERLRSLGDGASETLRGKTPGVAAGAAAGVSLLAALTYLLGRRRGRKRATVLEIRRV